MTSAPSDALDAHTFYNKPQQQGLKERDESRILYMRNFNNWIKSTLINEYLQRFKNEQPEQSNEIHVFDMGCGKGMNIESIRNGSYQFILGGDQLKWQSARVRFVTFAGRYSSVDLTENSVDVCKQRYNERKNHSSYKADFYTLDCTKELIQEKLGSNKPCFDLVSSQFVLHYSFDKIESADRFLRNAAELLRVGGYFIGTTVNSCQLVQQCRAAENQRISNDVYSIHFDPSIDLSGKTGEGIPLFGAKYHFNLHQVVDCPEYLVYFPLLEKLAHNHGLELVDRQTFKDYFDSNKDSREARNLLARMKALEYYELPSDRLDNNQGPPINHNQYRHAAKYINERNRENRNPIRSCRTLSEQEWEITRLYIIFAFKKIRYINLSSLAIYISTCFIQLKDGTMKGESRITTTPVTAKNIRHRSVSPASAAPTRNKKSTVSTKTAAANRRTLKSDDAQPSRSKSSVARSTRLPNLTRRTIRRQTTYLSVPSLVNGNPKGGQVLAVGENGMTQLGLKSSIDQRKNPQPVLIPEPIVQIAAGPLHSVCLTNQNNIYTFGCNDEHALGRPDNNDDDDDEDSDPFGEVNLNKIMNFEEEHIVQIVAGDSHTIVLSNLGKVYGRIYRLSCK
ncbi:unnamed protein product [Adineta ricciae]|uniref:mRNA (guanine-N(7))-methyltransferase n=1 Tax=Adineta ricciae TaxID=249248 RepID=A0A815CII7_ADIRI|nr:unnamed protein product [Adineta ricciae]